MNKIIAVTSGKGGTGKSTFSMGLAIALKDEGKSVLMIDMDLGLRCLDLLLGVDERVVFDISDLLSGKPFKQVKLSSPKYPGIDLVPASSSDVSLSAEAFGDFVKNVSELYDIVIVDFPAGANFDLYSKLPPNTTFVCVCNPNPISVRDTASVGKGLRDLNREGLLVVNKYDYYCLKNSVFKTLDDLIDISGFRLLGIIPLTYELEAAFYGGPFPVKKKEFKSYKRIAKRLLGEAVAIPNLKKFR